MDPSPTERTTGSRLWLFFILAFGISWAFWLAAVALNISLLTPAGRALEIAGNFGPFIAALVTVATAQGRDGLRDLWQRLTAWRLPAGITLTALLLPFILMGAALAVNLALGGSVQFRGLGVLLALIPIFLRSFFIAGGLNEETGWRGVALPRLLERFTPMRASLLLGLLWGLWHLPLYFFPDSGQSDMLRDGGSFPFLFGMFIVWAMGLSILFTWLHIKAGGSLWIVILFHAMIDTAAWLPSFPGIQAPMASMLYGAFTWVAAVIVARAFNPVLKMIPRNIRS